MFCMKACPCDDVAAAGSHHERRHLGSATSCAPTPDQAAATSGSSAPPRPATPVTGQATWPPSRRSWTTSSAARWTGTTSGSLQDDLGQPHDHLTYRGIILTSLLLGAPSP